MLAIDKKRREAQVKLDKNKQEANQLSSSIGSLMKEGKKDEANKIKEQVAALKDSNKGYQEKRWTRPRKS